MKRAEREEWADAKKAFKNHGLKGAKIDVFENLGWHSCLRHKHFAVWHDWTARDGSPRFTCMASEDGGGCGDMRWTDTPLKSYKTPKKALQATMRKIKAVIESENRFLKMLEECVK